MPDVVVCEFGARLDANGAAAAADQILKARHRMHGSRFFAFTVARSMSGTPTPLAVHGGGHTKAWKAEFKVTAAKPAGQVEQTKARVEARKLEIADERRAGRIKCAADPPGGHEGPA